MRDRPALRIIPIALVVAAAAWVVQPDNPGLRLLGLEREIRVVRGLDLQGGLRVLLEADLPPEVEITAEQMQTVRGIIENRVNGLGVTEPLVQVAGTRRIVVELPGIGDPDQAVAAIRETGLLEFVEVPESDVAGLLQGSLPLRTDYGAVAGADDDPQAPVYRTVMTGAALRNARVEGDELGRPVVTFELTPEGARIFSEYTRDHVGGFLAIVLDHQVLSIPQISQQIEGSGSITGDYTLQEANALAVQLRYGALPVPLRVIDSKTVGPTLGEDSLAMSATAGAIGLGVVALFMALYYRLPGLLADLALLVYTLVTFALFKIIPVTLTLPGVAGFVLSIGVAVDANILIFERMKEELRAGRPLRQAIEQGFTRAWPSIRDSNLATLITCAILYWFGATFGASIVKGFAVTLSLGVGVSLFTAITVTRTLLHVTLDGLRLPEHPGWFGIEERRP